MTPLSEKDLFLLWVAAKIAVALVLIALFASPGHSAELATCKVYANRGSAIALRQLLGLAFIDAAAGRFLYRKAYTFCLLQDEMPEISFTPEEQPIVTGMPSPPTRSEPVVGSVPATDPTDIPAAPVTPKAKLSQGGQPQALCTSHGKRTVYSNKHWRCVK